MSRRVISHGVSHGIGKADAGFPSPQAIADGFDRLAYSHAPAPRVFGEGSVLLATEAAGKTTSATWEVSEEKAPGQPPDPASERPCPGDFQSGSLSLRVFSNHIKGSQSDLPPWAGTISVMV